MEGVWKILNERQEEGERDKEESIKWTKKWMGKTMARTSGEVGRSDGVNGKVAKARRKDELRRVEKRRNRSLSREGKRERGPYRV